ncbi:hypothetical protein HG535_0G01010 [Zygotorulaspora mrakii]|uniref:XPG N-terminal domain-containing protein n=1 Tax=Zygotorulaspora mrakii TaxID=42260 RepID=A0A7H9B6L9_ZYGMR|nr:uncharacterized protein HG535_0G01010 [Zygotorulaspora mrakii]QLG74217.1 hypothetical protein HG535_0G01010 [Zygotorulaspora mrakii]
MPVKSLESYLFERGLVGSYPIEYLKNAVLGIDVNHYASRLLTSKREQYLDAIGGFPTSLRMYLESDLKVFKEFNITPLFVFNGSLVSTQLESSGILSGNADEANAVTVNASAVNSHNSSMNSANQFTKENKESIFIQRHKGWTQWNNLVTSNKDSYIDQPIQPQEAFRYNTIIETKRFLSDLIAYFIDHDILYQVAPYCSWAQLSYLLTNGNIDAIYGPTDCLMLNNVQKFILGMEFPNKEFRFIDKARVLREFGCSHEEFVDIAMAVGNDLQPFTLPPLQIYPAVQLFEFALEMVISTGTNFYAYQLSNPVRNESLDCVDKYRKGVSALHYMPVLKDTGKVEIFIEPETASNEGDSPKQSQTYSTGNVTDIPEDISSPRPIPSDVHDFIAQQLPSEYYFYKSLGLISGKLLDTISTGIYPEEPPLDHGSTNSYRKLVKDSVEVFKNNEINLLTQPINRYYQIKPIKQVKWFAKDDPVSITNRMTPSTFEKINHLVVKTDLKDKSFSISEFINLIENSKDLAEDFISEKVLFPNSVSADKKLKTSFDLLSTSFLRDAYILGFFEYNLNKKLLKPTVWGSILLQFNKLSIDPEYHEAFFVLLVFFKMNVLSLSEDTQPPAPSSLSQATLRSYPRESLYILVITRILTLFQVEQKPTNYYGPVDKKTLIFRDHLDFVKENLKELFEAVTVSSLTSGEFDRLSIDNSGWQKNIVRNLPFKLSTPSTVMAMMWEFFLQKYLHNGNAKADAFSLVVTEFSTFKSVPNLNEQFMKSQDFLTQCSALLNALAASKLIKSEDAFLFAKAVEYSGKAIMD